MGNLDLTTIAQGQLSMYQTSNDADNELDLALTDLLACDLSAGDVTVTAAQMVRAVCFQATGNTVARVLNFPAKRRLFIVENTGSHSLDVTLGTTTLSVAAADSSVFYADGTANGLATVVGSGVASVTSVGLAVPDDFVKTGSPVTSSGTLTLARGALATFAASAGANNDIDPGGGWPVGFDRLDVTGSVTANITSLKAGGDGQRVIVSNQTTGFLTLNNASGSGTAANRFLGPDDMALAVGLSMMIVYYAGSVNRWRMV